MAGALTGTPLAAHSNCLTVCLYLQPPVQTAEWTRVSGSLRMRGSGRWRAGVICHASSSVSTRTRPPRERNSGTRTVLDPSPQVSMTPSFQQTSCPHGFCRVGELPRATPAHRVGCDAHSLRVLPRGSSSLLLLPVSRALAGPVYPTPSLSPPLPPAHTIVTRWPDDSDGL